MKNSSEMVLKAFLSRCEPEKKRALEKFLPEKQQARLQALPDDLQNFNVEEFINFDVLEKVHWSWFLPTLKTYPETEQRLFLSAVDPYSAKNLAKTLLLSATIPDITGVAKVYLRQILLNSLLGAHNQLIPENYLPASPLKPLRNLSKQKLTHLIDLLSLYDLSAELRQIVETKILKKIYSFLSEEERNFLKTIQGHKDPFTLARMGLDRWDGTEGTLRTLLHRRGLTRFGAALSGQHPDLIWYVCHRLDIGRGNALFKQCMKEPIHGVSDVIIRQVEELL